MLKKISALLLALAMVMSLASVAWAADAVQLTDGEIGGSVSFATDNPQSQGKTIKIAKELTVFNVNETTINAPTISYTYAITAGSANKSITDATSDHANGTAVTVKTKAGVQPEKVTLTGTSTNTIAWTPTETVTASDDGTANIKYLTIDFSDVFFGAAGVYRYVLTETLPTSYAACGVTETTSTENPHVRYLDVYVRPAPTGFSDGTATADWDIYGYVCLLENEEITDGGDTATTGAVKTNGFVAGTNDGTAYLADQYYTYNVTVSKTVTNDNYAKATHLFPFTVIFTNATVTQPVDIIGPAEVTGTKEGWTDPVSAALSAGTTKGIVKIKDSASVKYIGIPNGTQVEVYETNDVPGVTYQVTTVTDKGTPAIDKAVISGTTPDAAEAQTTKADYQSTKTTITTTVDTDDDVDHTIEVDNNLQLISPTGVTLRIAPYALILFAGMALLLVSRRRKAVVEE